VTKYEKKSGRIHGQVWSVLTGKGGTPEAGGVHAATANTWTEMEKYHNGFCVRVTQEEKGATMLFGSLWID